jgi:preprotein translocase subunit SecA
MMRDMAKAVLLRAIDAAWVDHLVTIDHLRTGIGLRGYGQRDPLIEYKKETFHLFQELQLTIRREVVNTFFKMHIGLQLAPSIMATDTLTLQGAETTSGGDAGTTPTTDSGAKIGRNDPCYCGSGKKYKKCHSA